MKKILVVLLALCMLLTSFAACAPKNDPNSPPPKDTGASKPTEGADPEIVDGKFTQTRKITVEVFNRNNDGGTPPEDNVFANYIKEGMLRDHNVEVEFRSVPRWTETEVLNNLLAAGDAPDVCVTYSLPTIQSYAKMGGVLDLQSYVEENRDKLGDLTELITEENLLGDLDPVTNKLWSIQSRLFNATGQKTFIREDWLKKLNLPNPTNMEELEKTLYAFRDNAKLLLGDEADKMVPYLIFGSIAFELTDMMQTIVLPEGVTDKDFYIYGFDAQQFMMPNYKEGLRILNKWYNEGLLWKDFAVYPTGDKTSDNLKKAGYVGGYSNNSTAPYGGGEDSLQLTLKRVVGEDAAWTIIQPYGKDGNKQRKFWGSPIAYRVFFPATNDEPVASLMYLNWLSKVENRTFLQVGKEGVNHEVMPDGSYKMIQATGEYVMNSGNNLDYTIVLNGIQLANPDLTLKTLMQGFPGVEPKYIERAFDNSVYDNVYQKYVFLGEISAEVGIGEALNEKRNNLLNQAIVAPVDQFDKVFDAGYKDYMASGGQKIIDERKAAWEKVYGDKEMLD